MELELVLSFFCASILLTVMPGPDNIFVLTESLTKGHKQGLAISVGLVSGVLVHTAASATGLSLILQQSAIAFQFVKYLGAGYLFYLTYQAIGEKHEIVTIAHSSNVEVLNVSKLIQKGFLMNVLNPKVSLFFVAFLPQFISAKGLPIPAQMFILGVLFMVQALLIFSLISLLSGKLSKYLNNLRFWQFTKWTKVGALGILGVALAFSKK